MYLGHGTRFVGGHQHTIGNRCWCGVLTVPTRFHDRDGRGKVVGNKGEERYLTWLASDEKPAYVNPPVMAEINVTRDEIPNNVTGHPPIVGLGDDDCTQYIQAKKRGRPKKYKNRAAQQAAYRERRK